MAQTQAKPDAPQTTRGLTRVVPAHDPEWVAERKEARAQAVEADVRSAVEKLLHHCPSTRSDEATRARRALAENGSGLVYADAEDRCAYQLGWLLQRAQDLVKILNKITDERVSRADTTNIGAEI